MNNYVAELSVVTLGVVQATSGLRHIGNLKSGVKCAGAWA